MKQNNLSDINYKLSNQHYENIFNVYEDENLGYFYNLLKTVNFPKELRSDSYNIYIIQQLGLFLYTRHNLFYTIFLCEYIPYVF